MAGAVNGAAGGAAAPATPSVPPKILKAEQYDGYFVNNTYEPNIPRSVLVATTQKEFDGYFGAGFVMNDRSQRLAAGVFDKQLVVGVVRRGPTDAAYKLTETALADGVLTVKYTVTLPRGSGSATYASPLIFSVPKDSVTSVKFMENGAEVGNVKVAH